jgi:hypothetical protein
MSYIGLRGDTSEVAWAVMGESADEVLAAFRDRDVADLRWHWDEAYDISWDGRFRASRRDDGAPLDAGTAGELDQRIRRDYIERPVARPR